MNENELLAKIVELEEELKWKSELLNERTKTLYDFIQKAQDILNKLPIGMID